MLPRSFVSSGWAVPLLIALLAGLAALLGAGARAAVVVALVSGAALWLQRRALLGEAPAAAALSEAERSGQGARAPLLMAIGEVAPMAIVVYGEAGAISYCNAEARTLFAEDQPLENQNFLRLVQGAPPSLKEALVKDGDALFTVEQAGESETYGLSRRYFDWAGERHTLLMVKQLTLELQRRESDVWKNVIRIISHELNNSLAPISSMVHSARIIAQNPEQLPKLARVFDTIEERSLHLAAFLEGYARFARLPKPRPERVSWSSFLDGIQALFPLARFGPPPSTDGWFDRGQLQQVLINLLKNAQEASPDATEVELSAEVAEDGASSITVSDRGSGMSDEVMRHALVPFFSTKEQGTGLGLALCREIVDAHGGKLRLSRRNGGGMEVSCWLPGRASVAVPRTGRLTLTRG